jgi:hypothetical protein
VITRINGGPKTEAAVFSKFDEQFTPDWDKYAAGEQAMRRDTNRAKLGDKVTPLGPGKLMKAKR